MRADQTLLRELEARLRLALSLSASPLANGEQGDALRAFLEGLPLPIPPAATTAHVEVALSGRMDAMRWLAFGDQAAFFPWLQGWAAHPGADEGQVARLGAAGQALQPAWLGAYMEADADGLDLGWCFPGDVPLDDALPHLPPSGARDAVAQRLRGYFSARALCGSLTEPLGEVVIDFGEDALALRRALEALRIPYADALFESLPPEPVLGLRLRLGEGLLGAGVQVSKPPADLPLVWLKLHRGCLPDQVAAFEGTLGASPGVIEWTLGADGQGLLLRYDASAAPVAGH